MKARNLRWGYGRATAEGPMDGDTVVELCISANDRHNYFVRSVRRGFQEEIVVSTIPMFDIIIHTHHHDVDGAEELKKCEAFQVEKYQFEIGDAPKELEESEFALAIHLLRAAVQEYAVQNAGINDTLTAVEFFKPYAGKKLEKIKLPKLYR